MMSEEIIIIEDNDSMRLGIADSLKREGYKVSTYENGIDALKKFQFAPAALAIVDLKMEPVNGIEVLTRLKEINPATEVLMISAFGTVEDAVNAMKIGAADFL
ncbi:MAG: response regulator, partial [Ignavibacteriales bacterium]